ncbi:CaiB/BaiF CoA transferase family protein [Novosphingobium resinovorum]|uniref:Formyl-CoA transferase n=1 Tax=Novosphingobium resinovorum TaxID=158500 RepID=A0A031JUT9_9SPHN|nr:CaiB/BaiF CoA-transferase family protein [Novosphingobium resinovorum]AOR79485.1 formyl-CoA transferase [Novosphingobium resinovorum]EZP80573.1 L-carnitine dehydratase/bile acid-inducible protein F [Novosphingobium resinovorum]
MTVKTERDMIQEGGLPLSGIKVVEFSHMVMGPSTGVVMADLGAVVVKVEPIGGDRTRKLLGSGAGYFPMYNRNKQSIAIDLKSPEGVAAAKRLVDQADVLIENFRPGALAKLGLGPDHFAQSNPGLIYYSAKGFLTGPYENRAALDEVAQMMGGLAYMTGPSGRPLRAGASVIDVTGGMFGVIGILAALEQRHRTGKGAVVRSSLYETTAFLVGQHIAQLAVTGNAARPMPERISAWAIYDVFETARPEEQVFIGVVSDGQWQAFTKTFGLDDLAADPALAENNARVLAREALLPRVRELAKGFTREALLAKLEESGVAFAPIARPQDLLEDAHLNANGALVDLTLTDGRSVRLPALPVEIDGVLPGVRHDLRSPGEDSEDVLGGWGFGADEIEALLASGAIEGLREPADSAAK